MNSSFYRFLKIDKDDSILYYCLQTSVTRLISVSLVSLVHASKLVPANCAITLAFNRKCTKISKHSYMQNTKV